MLRRLLPLLAFIALAVLLAVGVHMNSGRDVSVLPSPLLNKPAPTFQLPTLATTAQGNESHIVDSKTLLGEPYLLNVWGSWCVNCREEHPVITRLASGGIVRVIGYNYKDETADANRWILQMGNPYAMVLVDADGRKALDWGIYGAPESFLVDAKGIIRWKHVGPITDGIVKDELMPLLRKDWRK